MPEALSESFALTPGQSVRSNTGEWYRVVRELGQGMSATAYLTLRTSGTERGTFYAIKIIREPFQHTRVEDFGREVEALDSLHHPAVMRIDDIGTFSWTGGRHPFYVCRYYTETLATQIARGLSEQLKISFTMQLLSALQYLAKREIVHCDIKPSNIYVSGADCVLADFGLMRFTRDEAGRPYGPSLHRYRTPDIVASYRGVRITPKSDVFQLGLVVAEMFTGSNLCHYAESGSEEVVLDPLPQISSPHENEIRGAISKMLEIDSYSRFTAAYLIDIWQKIYFSSLEQVGA